MRTEKREEGAQQACLAHLTPHACAGWQAQEPAAGDPHWAEMLMDNGSPRPRLSPFGDMGRVENLVHPGL